MIPNKTNHFRKTFIDLLPYLAPPAGQGSLRRPRAALLLFDAAATRRLTIVWDG